MHGTIAELARVLLVFVLKPNYRLGLRGLDLLSVLVGKPLRIPPQDGIDVEVAAALLITR